MAGPLKVQIVYGFTGHGYILKYNIVRIILTENLQTFFFEIALEVISGFY